MNIDLSDGFSFFCCWRRQWSDFCYLFPCTACACGYPSSEPSVAP